MPTTELFWDDTELPFEGSPDVVERDGRGPYIPATHECNRCFGKGQVGWHPSGLAQGRCYRCGGDPNFREHYKRRLVTQRTIDNRRTRAEKAAAEFAANEAREVFYHRIRTMGIIAQCGIDVIAAARKGWQNSNEFDRGFWYKFYEHIRHGYEGDVMRMLPTARRIVAENLAAQSSEHIGAEGEPVELDVVVIFTKCFETYYGLSCVTKMRTDDGNMATYFGMSIDAQRGDRLTLRATVKEHSLYEGIKETIINRPRNVTLISETKETVS